ncbi:MAG: preprotein translocase subunit SecE [Ruminococcaceae bacterium]|nr:preprotein translocase subunit SecE [Oscillospiraceae bacterium]
MAENKKKESELTSEVAESKKGNEKPEAKEVKPAKVKKEGWFSKLVKLFKGSKSELSKVTWAGKTATTKNSLLVLVVLVIVGVAFGLFDMGFNWLITHIIDLY